MNLKEIKRHISNYNNRINSMLVSKDYYNGDTDIKKQGAKVKDSFMRNADNRVSHDFHRKLVDEKASYLFTYKVMLQLDDKNLESTLHSYLGAYYEKVLKKLCIESSNSGLAWLHYWISDTNEFKYTVLPSEQIIPVYEPFEDEPNAIIRAYSVTTYDINDREIITKKIELWSDLNNLELYTLDKNDKMISHEVIPHNLNCIPFIKFANNINEEPDIKGYKQLIDIYDRVASGFVNDLDDIQQVFFVIKGYGGVTEEEITYDEEGNETYEEESQFKSFLRNLKLNKTVPLDEGGDFSKVTIDIPTQARDLLLKNIKDLIVEFGQGLQNVGPEGFGNASGVALKFFYRNLEAKAGLLEPEFRYGISKLSNEILRLMNNTTEVGEIRQTWTRNMISNDLEMAQVAQMSAGILPEELIYRYHPLVDDVIEALELREKEMNSTMKEEFPVTFPLEEDTIE